MASASTGSGSMSERTCSVKYSSFGSGVRWSKAFVIGLGEEGLRRWRVRRVRVLDERATWRVFVMGVNDE